MQFSEDSDSDDIIMRHDSDKEDDNAAEGIGETPATLAFWANLPGVSAFLRQAEGQKMEGVQR